MSRMLLYCFVVTLLLLVFPLHAEEAERPLLIMRLQAIAEDIQQWQQQIADTEGALGQLESRLAQLSRRNNRTGMEIKQLEKQLHQLAKQRKQQLQLHQQYGMQVEQNRLILAEQIRLHYQRGSNSRLQILLNQNQPDLVQRLTDWHGYVTAHYRTTISLLEQQTAVLRSSGEKLAAQEQDIQQQKAHHAKRQKTLQRQQQQRLVVATQWKQQLDEQEQTLAGLHIDEQQLQRLLNTLDQALDDVPYEPLDQRAFSHRKNNLRWPLSGHLLTTAVTAGNPRPGVFIQVAAGSSVYSVASGRIAFANYMRGYGLLLVIDHGEGYMSLYGQNQGLLKAVGDWVAEGELVAYSGRGNRSQDAALYFEIRVAGKPRNPADWCFSSPRHNAWDADNVESSLDVH